MPKLLIKHGEKKGFVFTMSGQAMTIGRDPSNDMVIPDHRVSRAHVRICQDGQNYCIEDLNSFNGVKVNGKKIQKQVLELGDDIQVGSTLMAFLALNAPEQVETTTTVPKVHVLTDPEAGQKMTVEMMVNAKDTSSFAHGSSRELQGLDPAKALARLSVLYEVSFELGHVIKLQQLLERVLELVMTLMKAERGFIMLRDEESGQLVMQVVRSQNASGQEDISVSKTILNRVAEAGESVLTSDASEDPRFREAQSVILQGIRSAMCVALKSKDKILGILYMDCRGQTHSFTKDDLELLTAISFQASAAIENAKLFEELTRANRELKERQNQLIEAEKLSALGQLAGGIAHEINNPMTCILGYAELSEKILSDKEFLAEKKNECSEFVKIIHDEAKRCQHIVQSLLQFARRKKTEMSEIQVNAVLESTLEIARFHMKKVRIDIKKQLADALPPVLADANQLQQVFLNLIINARDAMEKGGTLTIETGLKDKWVYLKFSDTGCGIPQEIMDKIFQPLFTTKEEGKGTGLGLSISQEIVERHQGNLDVESVVGRGTTFTIRLPAK